MRTLFLLTVIVLCCGYALALGGYRHRNKQKAYFSWGYGPHREFPETDERRTQEEILDALLSENDEDDGPCFGKRCLTDDRCCKGAVCVNVDGMVGTCLPVYGARKGEPCQRDSDCATGLYCIDSGDNEVLLRTCQAENRSFLKKQYNEECDVSGDCDLEKGLCCQLQKRHRQAAKKLCVYYKEPQMCIGNMEGAPKPPPVEPKMAAIKARLG